MYFTKAVKNSMVPFSPSELKVSTKGAYCIVLVCEYVCVYVRMSILYACSYVYSPVYIHTSCYAH